MIRHDSPIKILNFGSLNIDFVYSVDEFVRKGETIASHDLQRFPGGKGLNQSLALARAGANVFHAGLVGPDGVFLRTLLEQSGVDVSHVLVHDEVQTGNAIIQRDSHGDNCIILYGGANTRIDVSMVDRILDGFGRGDWLLLQNEISELSSIIDIADSRGMTIVLNPSPIDNAIFEANLDAVSLFVLNEGEASAFAGRAGEPRELLRAMQERFPASAILLTVGERGALFSRDKEILGFPAFKVETVDTTAAGDTFTGFFLAELISGSSEYDSLRTASAAASIAVSRIGAAPSIPTLAEVLRFLERHRDNSAMAEDTQTW